MWSVMWPKFGNSSISTREVIIISMFQEFDQKKLFLRGALASSSIIWTGTNFGLEILHQCGQRVKNESKKVFGANSCVCRSCREKMVAVVFLIPPIVNRFNTFRKFLPTIMLLLPAFITFHQFFSTFYYLPRPFINFYQHFIRLANFYAANNASSKYIWGWNLVSSLITMSII